MPAVPRNSSTLIECHSGNSARACQHYLAAFRSCTTTRGPIDILLQLFAVQIEFHGCVGCAEMLDEGVRKQSRRGADGRTLDWIGSIINRLAMMISSSCMVVQLSHYVGASHRPPEAAGKLADRLSPLDVGGSELSTVSCGTRGCCSRRLS